MRTDVKVGLVCVLALVMAVIGYFALQSKPSSSPNIRTNSSLTSSTPVDSPAAPQTQVADSVAATPPAASPPATATPPAAPDMGAPPVAFSPQPALGQTPSIYSPPSSPATAPAGGSTLYPPGGSPRGTLLPPLTTGGSTTGPAASGADMTGPGAPTLGGTPSGTGSGRPTEVEPGARPRDTLLEPLTPSHGTSGGLTPSHDLGPATPGALGGTTYAVQNGDNLTVIAKKNHTTVVALKAANPTINPDRLKIKQVINLPAPGSTPPPTAPTTRPAHSSTRPATTRPHGSTAHPAAVAAGTYRVKKGDTLRKIAKAVYGDEKLWRRIFRVNRGELASANDIEPGMVLKIPAR